MGKGKFLGEFEHIVLLAVLQKKGDGYGMSLRREIEARTDRSVSIGAIYATLDRLETKGYIASREGEATPIRGGRAKRLFTVLPAGGRALRDSRRVLDQMWDGIDPEVGPETA